MFSIEDGGLAVDKNLANCEMKAARMIVGEADGPDVSSNASDIELESI